MIELMKSAKKQLKRHGVKSRQFYDKSHKFMTTPRHKSLIYRVLLALSIILLVSTAAYAGLHASDTYSTDANAIILTQQFSKGASYPAILPGPHATLIIIPIVFIQGHLPYHYTSFTLVNTGLVLVTMLAWAFLLIKLFGRRYEIPILIFLASLVFTSIAFSLSIGYTTIRNIEYPIALWFVLIVGDLLRKRLKYSRKQFVFATAGSALFSIVLAGDSFFNYAILLPLLFVMVWYWVQSREFTANMLKALGLLVGVVIGASLLKLVLSKAGIIHFDYTFWGQNSILPTDKIWSAVGVALQQFLDLHGASIFGQVVNYHNLSIFVNFGLTLAGLVGLLHILRDANRNYRNKQGLNDTIVAGNNDFALVVMAVSYFVVFLIYVLSGYAITTLPNGAIISDQNARYISLMPFISVIGLVWLVKKYYTKHVAFLTVLCLVLVLGIITSYPGISLAYKERAGQLELAPPRSSISNLIGILNQNDIKQVSADYWYGPIIRFWSDSSIGLTKQVGCDPSILSTDANNFTRQRTHNVALIIDRGGLNYSYWTCTDDQLLQFYGTPTKKLQVPGAAPNTFVDIWVYDN